MSKETPTVSTYRLILYKNIKPISNMELNASFKNEIYNIHLPNCQFSLKQNRLRTILRQSISIFHPLQSHFF